MCARAPTATTPLANKCFARVEEVVTAAFPFATIAVNPILYDHAFNARATANKGGVPFSSSRSPLDIGAQLEQHAPLDWKGEVGRTCSAFDTTGAFGSSALWSSLYYYFDVTSPRCPWLCDGRNSTHDGVDASRALPCWTPHGVVFLGGYERIDLRRIVLPALEEHIPSRNEDPPGSGPSGDRPLPSDQRRRPRYEQHFHRERDMLQKHGCSIMGDDTMELSLQRENGGEDGERGKASSSTFLLFANPATRIADLHKAETSMKCNPLRSAFGYSLRLITNALPPPMVLAARLLDDCASAQGCSSLPFWLSATAHTVARAPAGCIGVQAVSSSALSPNARQYLRRLVDKLERMPEREAVRVPPRPVETQLVGYVLALQVLDNLNGGEATLLPNYFLPQETFEGYADVQTALRNKKTLRDDMRRHLRLKDVGTLSGLTA